MTIAHRAIESSGASNRPATNHNLNERKSRETHTPLPQPIALSQELSAKSYYSNQAGGEVELRLSSGAFRIETTTQSVGRLNKTSGGVVESAPPLSFQNREI